MIYLYAQTGKEFGLDALRRVASIYQTIKDEEVGVLVSDFRAQHAGVSFGLPLAVPIEDIGLIGGIVDEGDTILLDTTEDLNQFIQKFEIKFAKIIRVSRDCNTDPIYNETVLSAYGKDEDYGYWQLQRVKPKENSCDKTVLYYGDSDTDLYLLNHREIFQGLDISLIWGEYFYVKYEDDYADSFNNIYESDEFEEMLEDGVNIITASIQIASEYCVAGYSVLLIDRGDFNECQRQMIDELGIETVSIDNREKIASFIESTYENTCKETENKSLNIKDMFQ